MAVADAAQDSESEPPPEVVMVGRIKQWGDPWGGGWMQWPAGLVKRLTIADNVTAALQSAGNAKPGEFAAWEESHHAYAKTYDGIMTLRVAMAARDGN